MLGNVGGEEIIANDFDGRFGVAGAVGDDLADLFVGGLDVADDGLIVLHVDAEFLDDGTAAEFFASLDGRRGRPLVLPLGFIGAFFCCFFGGLGGGFAEGALVFFDGEFEFLALDFGFLFLESELFAPFFLGEGFFADGLEIGKRAAEGAFGLGFIAIEEVDSVESASDQSTGSGCSEWRSCS